MSPTRRTSSTRASPSEERGADRIAGSRGRRAGGRLQPSEGRDDDPSARWDRARESSSRRLRSAGVAGCLSARQEGWAERDGSLDADQRVRTVGPIRVPSGAAVHRWRARMRRTRGRAPTDRRIDQLVPREGLPTSTLVDRMMLRNPRSAARNSPANATNNGETWNPPHSLRPASGQSAGAGASHATVAKTTNTAPISTGSPPDSPRCQTCSLASARTVPSGPGGDAPGPTTCRCLAGPWRGLSTRK